MDGDLMSGLLRQWPRLLLYACLLTALWFFPRHMRGMLYQPPDFPTPPPPAGFSEVMLPLENGNHAMAWLMPAPAHVSRANTPVVLFFHGNAENLGVLAASGLFRDFARLEVDFLALDYPGYGRSSGAPSEATLRESGARAMDFLAATRPDAPVVLVGFSLGAALAVETARLYSDQVSGLILFSPWSSLDDLARHHFPNLLVSLILKESYPSEQSARGLEIPALVFHGEQDEIIPFSQGRRVAAALPQSKWIPIAGAGHNNVMSAPLVWAELKYFFDDLNQEMVP